MACPCANKLEVILTCLSCGRSRQYRYSEKKTLAGSLKIRKLICICHEQNWDLENVEVIEKDA